MVTGAFVGLGTIAALVGWIGVAVGVLLLGWAIAGSVGKIKGPINLVFPQSAKKTALSAVGIGLGTFVTMCGVMGGVAKDARTEKAAREATEKADREAAAKAEEQRQASEVAAAKAAREAQLTASAATAAIEYAAGLDAVEGLLTAEKWVESDEKLKGVAMAVAEYRALTPVPPEIAALVPRHEALSSKLGAKRREREAIAWIERAEAVVGEKSRCEDADEVESARRQVEGLQASDPLFARVAALNAKLDECIENMPAPSAWIYSVRGDPMGGTVGVAKVESSNTFSFGFPYHGEQHGGLTIRDDKGINVLVTVERGQFMCTMGCSVMVRFDDAPAQRWRATGPSDMDSTVIFLRNESKFLKQVTKARIVRIEAEFYQEGARVLEFPVARLDMSQIK